MKTDRYQHIYDLRRAGDHLTAIALLRVELDALAAAPPAYGEPPAAPYMLLARCYRHVGDLDREIALIDAYMAAGGSAYELVSRRGRAVQLQARGDALDAQLVAAVANLAPGTAASRLRGLRQLRLVLLAQGLDLDGSEAAQAAAERWAAGAATRREAWRWWMKTNIAE